MDEKHRSQLRKSRTKIIDNVANPLEVSESLYEHDIFTESMKQDVEAEKTQHSQMRKILDILPKRGPRAFEAFQQCLRETGNSDAVALLGGAVQVQQHHHDVLPKDWPNEKLITREISVIECNVHSEIVRKYWNNPHETYSMKKRQRGRCVIISNKFFTGPLEKDKDGKQRVTLTTRTGTDKDASDVEKLFRKLHFTVVRHNDKEANEIRTILLQESTHSDQAHAECFVFIICSHGTSTGVYGKDGKVVSLEEITAKFDGNNCPNLVNKPKLFFIQACQGETVDRQSSPVEDVGQDLSRLHLNGSNAMDAERENPIAPAPQNTGVRVPVKADILVACATHPGYVSIRNELYGSWFLQAVVYVLQHFSHEESILDLFLKVNDLVSRGVTEAERGDAGGVMQASNVTNSFRKKFYFFPGIIADTES